MARPVAERLQAGVAVFDRRDGCPALVSTAVARKDARYEVGRKRREWRPMGIERLVIIANHGEISLSLTHRRAPGREFVIGRLAALVRREP